MEQFIRHQPVFGEQTFDISQVQDNVGRVLDEITIKPQMDSFFLDRSGNTSALGIALVAGVENWIEHGLGRAILGWDLKDIQAPAMVWRVATSTADLEKYLPLGTTANVTVMIEVF